MHTHPGESDTLTDGQMVVDCQEAEKLKAARVLTQHVGNSDDLRDNERQRSC